ncbi:PilZ domain-containing protein [Myxococcota bacterium]|nr:PilZ domain-containing protein [Myxococcota bacterium]MBU1498795.1 PilZ domain-containing protein [Myxococcota bacterium]
MDNRRKFIRKEIHMAVEIITESNIFTGITLDISKGGMAVEIDGPCYSPSNVQVGFFRIVDGIEEDQDPIGLAGSVAWARIIDPGRFSAGIKFDSLSKEEEAYIAWLLNQPAHNVT